MLDIAPLAFSRLKSLVVASVLLVGCMDSGTSTAPQTRDEAAAGPTGFRLLVFPLPGLNSQTAQMNAVFDHSMQLLDVNHHKQVGTYCADDGETGLARC